MFVRPPNLLMVYFLCYLWTSVCFCLVVISWKLRWWSAEEIPFCRHLHHHNHAVTILINYSIFVHWLNFCGLLIWMFFFTHLQVINLITNQVSYKLKSLHNCKNWQFVLPMHIFIQLRASQYKINTQLE